MPAEEKDPIFHLLRREKLEKDPIFFYRQKTNSYSTLLEDLLPLPIIE